MIHSNWDVGFLLYNSGWDTSELGLDLPGRKHDFRLLSLLAEQLFVYVQQCGVKGRPQGKLQLIYSLNENWKWVEIKMCKISNFIFYKQQLLTVDEWMYQRDLIFVNKRKMHQNIPSGMCQDLALEKWWRRDWSNLTAAKSFIGIRSSVKETNRGIWDLCSLYLLFIRAISLSTYWPAQVDICRAWEAWNPQQGVSPLPPWLPLGSRASAKGTESMESQNDLGWKGP